MTRTLPPGDPLGPEGTVMSGPEGQAGVTAAFREDEARDRAGKWTGHGGGGQPDAHDMVSRSVAAFRSGTDYPPAPARPAGLRMGPVKQCYSNAAQAAIDHRLPYAEGYALSGRIGYWVITPGTLTRRAGRWT